MIEKFKLGAVEWTVEMNNQRLNDREAFGICDYAESKILVQDTTEGRIRKKDSIDQTLYHEIVHAILFSMSENELAVNEKFVQTFSMLLHQFEETKR